VGTNNLNISFLSSLINLALFIFFIITMWKIFSKAGKSGWASLIPIYNLYILLKIANKPGWWLILYFIPVVNLFVYIFFSGSIARMFGKSTFFGIIMLAFFSFIGYPILAFGKSKYIGINNQMNQPPSATSSVDDPNVLNQPNPLSQPIIQKPLNQQPPTKPIQQDPIMQLGPVTNK
jgi:hypothetical protein